VWDVVGREDWVTVSGAAAARSLAGELRLMRGLSGRSLKELESLTFVSDSSLSRYLSGRLLPPWPVVAALCRAVRRDPAELRPLWEQARAMDEPGRNFLPRDAPDFTDRADLVRLLSDDPPAGQIEVINGMAGVGKTTLAIHVGHRLAGRFPDGQFYVDLRGYTPGQDPVEPVAALRTLLTAAGVAPAAIPDEEAGAAAQWRGEMSGRRAVVVLDNAANAGQVRPLLPGSASCRVIVTSRQQLLDLDGVRPVPLDVLSVEDAAGLFQRAWGGAADPAADPVVRLCGFLPLAIRIAASRLRHRPQWTVGHLAELLHDERRRLSTLEAGERGVASAFGLSYRRLDGEHRRMFRLLGLAPAGGVDRYAAAALTDTVVEAAEAVLEDLVDAHLVEQPTAGRYRQHDLLREYARQMLTDTDRTTERDAALDRLLDYYLHAATVAGARLPTQTWSTDAAVGTAPAALPPLTDPASSLDWLDGEATNLVAIAQQAAATGRDRHAATLPQMLHGYFQMRGRVSDCLTMAEAGLVAAQRLGDLAAQARLHRTRALVLAYAGKRTAATSEATQSLRLARQVGDRHAEVLALHTLGMCSYRWNEFAAALPWYEQAAALRREYGQSGGNASPIAVLGMVQAFLGRYDDAERHAREALAIAEPAGDDYTGMLSLFVLGLVAHRRGRHPEALDHLHRALSAMRATGHLVGEEDALNRLAEVYIDTGDLTAAGECLDQATEADTSLAFPAPDHHLLNTRGRLHLAAGRTSDALRCHRDALALAVEFGDRYGEAHARSGIAAALRATDPDPARIELTRARDLFTQLGVPEANEPAR
jgi:tetratricopeptide (TPR) repeat protein/transcriptional regulator with XRE-family HTH domain